VFGLSQTAEMAASQMEKFEFINELGRGAFGVVYKVSHYEPAEILT
jgi:hypothetical protein